MSRKRLQEMEHDILRKERKCEKIIWKRNKLSDNLTQIEQDIFQINIKKDLVISKVNHPLFTNLYNILLEEIISICIDYSNVLICPRCLNCYPSKMLRSNELSADCFRHNDFFKSTRNSTHRNFVYFSGDVYINNVNKTIIFECENDEELWKYFTSFFVKSKLFFGSKKAKSSGLKIEFFFVKYDDFGKCYLELLVVDECYDVYITLTGTFIFDNLQGCFIEK